MILAFLRLCLWAMIVFFPLAGIGALTDNWIASKTSYWPSTEGIVTVSRLDTTMNANGRYISVANISYRYEIDGTSYTSFRIGYGEGQPRGAGAVNMYPLNRRLRVYYDPEDPSSSCLEVGGSSWLAASAKFLLMVGLGALAFFGSRQIGTRQEC